MITEIKNNLETIIATCNNMQLQHLYVFGSAARAHDFNDNSDIDFLYRFKKDAKGFPVSGFDYFDLLLKLEEITGRKVDLVAEEKMKNKYFIERVEQEKIKIYED